MATVLAEHPQAITSSAAGSQSSRQRQGPRLALGIALAVLSALLGTWASPPYGLWPLVFVAWVPMLVAQHHVLPKRWGWVAFGIGIGGYYAGYLHGVVSGNFAAWGVWIPAVVGLLAGVGAIADRPMQEASGYVRFVVTGPLTWAAVEFLRGFAPALGTQGYVAYALYHEPPLLQPVSVVGTSALNLLIFVVNWTIALGLLVVLDRLRRQPRRLISTRVFIVSGLASAVLVALWGSSSVLLFRSDPPTVKVAAIQPGIHTPGAADFRRDMARTRLAASKGAKLVVWQEGTLWSQPQGTPVGSELSTLARESHIYLVIGYKFVTAGGQHNDATVIAPSGRYLGVYGKQHPAIMFGDDQTSVDAGTMPVYRTPFGRLATMICFDGDFTDTARSAAAHGAQMLAVPTWDWQGIAPKHYGPLVFRAIENRLTIVKGEFSYDSVVIDPYGRIVASAVFPRGGQATVLAKVPVGSGKPPLVTLGNFWGWLIVAGAVSNLVMPPRRRPAAPVPESR